MRGAARNLKPFLLGMIFNLGFRDPVGIPKGPKATEAMQRIA